MIRLRYQPTFRDYRELNLHAFFRGFRPFLIPAGILIVIVLLSWPFFSSTDGYSHGLAEAILSDAPLLVGLVVVPILFNWKIRRRWNAAREVRSEKEYEFDESGFNIKGENFSSHVEWSLITKADCNREYFFLRTGQNLYYYFPVSAVPDKKSFTNLVSGKTQVTKNWNKAISEF